MSASTHSLVLCRADFMLNRPVNSERSAVLQSRRCTSSLGLITCPADARLQSSITHRGHIHEPRCRNRSAQFPSVSRARCADEGILSANAAELSRGRETVLHWAKSLIKTHSEGHAGHVQHFAGQVKFCTDNHRTRVFVMALRDFVTGSDACTPGDGAGPSNAAGALANTLLGRGSKQQERLREVGPLMSRMHVSQHVGPQA